MKNRKKDTRWMALLAMMVAVELVLVATGIGLIPLPVIKATTLHIPVILGAVLLGPLAGGILGAVFGLSSMWINTTAPGLLAFAFSPFMSTTGLPGALKAVWIAVGCRILIGVVSGWLWIALKRVRVNDYIALPVVGVAGAMTNTVLVMGSIYFLLAQQYAEVKNVALDAVFGLVMATVTASGIHCSRGAGHCGGKGPAPADRNCAPARPGRGERCVGVVNPFLGSCPAADR